MSLPVVVLAGGLATRLQPLTQRVPKVLLEVAGRPFAEHQLELLRRHNLRDVVFCLGHYGEQVQEALGDGSRWGMQCRYSFDGPVLLGTGGAIRRALPLVSPAFFVMYGDSYLECDFSAVERMYLQSRQPGLMTVYRNDDRFDRSNVQFDEGRILRYDKVDRTPAMNHIDYGLGVLTPMAFAPWVDHDAPFDLAAVYQRLVERQELAGFEVATRFYEIGSPEGLQETRDMLTAKLRH